MVSLVIICPGPWPWANCTAIVLWQPTGSGRLGRAGHDSDEPGTDRADTQAVGRRSDIGAEYDAGLAQTEDGAGGGPAEEQTCSRGRGMRLLKIGSSGLGCEDGTAILNGSVEAGF